VVFIDLDSFPVAAFDHSFQLQPLVIGCLLGGGDTKVEGNAFCLYGHARIVSEDHTVNKCLRYGKTATSEAPFLLSYREANSEGFSVWVITFLFLDVTVSALDVV
jgi:hypothetical protein